MAQDMVLSHRAKFQLIINFSGFQCIMSYFYRTIGYLAMLRRGDIPRNSNYCTGLLYFVGRLS